MLTLAATPIGNLEDISQRLARVLAEADYIFAEDTRHSGKLLRQLGIHKPLSSFHEHSRPTVLERIGMLLREGRNLVYISDAGMPGINDPGYRLVRLAHEVGAAVDAVPGPCAVINALVLSGLPCHEFAFLGFFPEKASQRQTLVDRLAGLQMTAVFFESPQRVGTTLRFLEERIPSTPIAVCREMTKLHQEVIRGTPAEVVAVLENPRGEFTLVVGAVAETENEPDLKQRFQTLSERGLSRSQAIRALAQERRMSKRQIQRLLEVKTQGP